ncbi:hypothetical protein A1OE_1111 [Candidatus Endolissoclinum faulkneri L2]|uniref:Uncharacterized protein n=1 Tax=Candidatus Endolissoclinum faulkneri L2 TaxID=1193729 RepID=K7YRW3_9PROT|nr:hypothetical protein A1OE_1111 [Candidatus Endolissoclinum faulkneri L2]
MNAFEFKVKMLSCSINLRVNISYIIINNDLIYVPTSKNFYLLTVKHLLNLLYIKYFGFLWYYV